MLLFSCERSRETDRLFFVIDLGRLPLRCVLGGRDIRFIHLFWVSGNTIVSIMRSTYSSFCPSVYSFIFYEAILLISYADILLLGLTSNILLTSSSRVYE